MSFPVSNVMAAQPAASTPVERSTPLAWFSVLGPVALGSVLGLGAGPLGVLQRSLGLPALVLGLTGALAPALYIGLAMADGSISALQLKRALTRALAATGVTMAGLTPATLFLVSTASSGTTVLQLGSVAAGFSAVLGMKQLGAELSPPPMTQSPRATLVLLAWCVIALLLAAHLFHDLLVSGRAA